ncbi:FtsB family cell division protein [Aquipuribacter sp. SD81]|uniref:FtsB family cell division protein n=1 Tax=Aquipuribacter sp. SD81 TaxID=3127703 RepID=UPI003019E027
MTRSATTRGRDPRGARTRRVVVLLALGVVCALVLAPPLRLYVQQQQDIAEVRAEIAEREAAVDRLEGDLELWDDEAYVAAQARERLGLVRPGEVGYVVPEPRTSLGADEVAAGTDGAPGAADGTADGALPGTLERPDAAPEGTWYGRLWSSVEAVGAGAAGDPVLDAPVVSDGVTEPSPAPSAGG